MCRLHVQEVNWPSSWRCFVLNSTGGWIVVKRYLQMKTTNTLRPSTTRVAVPWRSWSDSVGGCGRNDQQAEVSMVTMILEKRFSPESEYSLTLPERALLGVNYSLMVLGLDEAWAVERRADSFPARLVG